MPTFQQILDQMNGTTRAYLPGKLTIGATLLTDRHTLAEIVDIVAPDGDDTTWIIATTRTWKVTDGGRWVAVTEDNEPKTTTVEADRRTTVVIDVDTWVTARSADVETAPEAAARTLPSAQATYIDVLRAVENTRAGQILGSDAAREIADATLATLGLPRIDDDPLPNHTGPDAALHTAIDALASFTPELGWPQTTLDAFAATDYADADTVDGFNEVPLLSEAALYPLLGKEDARTVLARLRQLRVAAGMDPWG